jgi:hypothetical protein
MVAFLLYDMTPLACMQTKKYEIYYFVGSHFCSTTHTEMVAFEKFDMEIFHMKE